MNRLVVRIVDVEHFDDETYTRLNRTERWFFSAKSTSNGSVPVYLGIGKAKVDRRLEP